jgi:hypothetical protein
MVKKNILLNCLTNYKLTNKSQLKLIQENNSKSNLDLTLMWRYNIIKTEEFFITSLEDL